MSIKTIFISIAFFLPVPLWCAVQENIPESDSFIRTRRISQSQNPIENLEKKKAIASSLHQFFEKFDETATNLMVLNNLCEAMNKGMSLTVQIWEHYISEHKVLTTGQMPLFRTVYGNVLSALREEGPSYFDPTGYFKSSCFLELLYGELGEESFPRTYLKPLVFAEWRIYQRNGIVYFAENFALCLGEITGKIQSFIDSAANSIERWDTLPLEELEPIKEGFDFKDSLETLRLLKFKTVHLGLKETSKICGSFLNSVNTFHEACSPLALALQVIISNKKIPKKKTSHYLEDKDLQTWSIEGSKISTLISPILKEKKKSTKNPDYILTTITNSLKEDAEACPKFQIKGGEDITCPSMEINTSEISIEIFLRNFWPTFELFFKEGGLVPFGVYGAQNNSKAVGLLAQIEALKEQHFRGAAQAKELSQSLNKQLLERIRTLQEILLEKETALTETRISLKEEASQRAELAASHLRSAEDAEKKSKKFEKLILSQKNEIGTLQAKLRDSEKKLKSLPQKTKSFQPIVENVCIPQKIAPTEEAATAVISQNELSCGEAQGNTPPTSKRKSPPPIERDLPPPPEPHTLRPEAPDFRPSQVTPSFREVPPLIPRVFLPPTSQMVLVQTPYGMAWAPAPLAFHHYG